MKLYYSPGACSLSAHIVLREAGLAFEPVAAPTKTHKLNDGTDYYTINPLGYVPMLELDDGTRLREVPAILQYLADQVPLKNLAPANGTLPRYRLQEWLGFIGTELHKSFSPLFVAAIAFLAFVGGAMAMLGETFPHRYLRDAYLAGEALIAQREETADPYVTDQWRKARDGEKGVSINDPARASEGYTLYTSAGEAAAHLIDMDGRVVHEWRRPYSDVWTEQSAVKKPQPDAMILLDKARLLPNGDLLAIYAAAGDTPWGYGMVRMDRDSNVIWSYLAHTHHDFDIAPDGRILVLTNAFTSDDIDGLGKVDKPFLEDFVVMLSPDGRELKTISLTRALAKSRYKLLRLAIPNYALGDPLHTNSVQYITAEQAKNFPFAKEGDLLLSFRDISAIAVFSQDSGEIRWAMRGPWLWQHDASLLANGHITLFDNLGGFRPSNSARVPTRATGQ